ncbi:MAG: hypothetical protein ABJO09_01195 [Hyphomicrobiales bacterium]
MVDQNMQDRLRRFEGADQYGMTTADKGRMHRFLWWVCGLLMGIAATAIFNAI